jgi:hypothetical protein
LIHHQKIHSNLGEVLYHITTFKDHINFGKKSHRELYHIKKEENDAG